ncbi:MAG TPA: hypothetical protein VJS17_13490 [Pyrinomonadaceae bacterium]|nr:hypothetical protein [Pyrinomonadaceae bacterium]
MTASLRLRYLILVLLLCLAQSVSAQQEAHNYGFVSPNTKENLKLEDAIAGMSSPEEAKLLKQSINMGCVVRSRIRAFKALGSWSDGAEHSVMLRVRSDEPTVRYLLSRLGRDARQKSILYFHPQHAGTADLYTLQPRMRNLTALANALDRAGIAFRTLVPLKSGTSIYIVDLKRELRAKVMAAAKRLGARVRVESGTAAFVGDDQAEQAQGVFQQEIQNYETKNPNLPPTCDVQKRPKQR